MTHLEISRHFVFAFAIGFMLGALTTMLATPYFLDVYERGCAEWRANSMGVWECAR